MLKTLRTAGSLVLIAIFGLAATGCGSSTSNNSKTTYQVRIWRLNQTVDPIKGNISDFQKKNSSVVITYFDKNSATNYEDTALRSMASKNGPDIWSIPDDWLGDEESVIAPVPSNFFQDPTANCPNTPNASANPQCLSALSAAKILYPAGIVQQITSDDGKNLLGIPTNVDTLHLYVNTDLLGQAYSNFKAANKNAPDSVLQPVKTLLSNPPTTWNDLVSQTQYLTERNGNSITQSAIALGTADNIPNSADILQLLMLQNDVPIVSSDRERTLIDETTQTSSGSNIRPGQDALQFYTSFSDPTKSNYTWNASMPSALDAFGQGKVAMVIGYTSFGNQLAIKYPKLHPTVTSVPQVSLTNPAINLISFSVETVTQTANSQGAAFAFLKTYTDENTTSGLASDLKLRSPYLDTLNKKSDDPFDQAVLTGQAIFKKDRTDFDNTFNQMITDVDQNNVDPGTALDTGAQTINNLLTPPPDTSN